MEQLGLRGDRKTWLPIMEAVLSYRVLRGRGGRKKVVSNLGINIIRVGLAGSWVWAVEVT